ncbi:MAG: hypothetical protein FWG13_03920 [Leptospirales bacterium]|nr:hypothetical protein [Leptospirales bacterium]
MPTRGRTPQKASARGAGGLLHMTNGIIVGSLPYNIYAANNTAGGMASGTALYQANATPALAQYGTIDGSGIFTSNGSFGNTESNTIIIEYGVKK